MCLVSPYSIKGIAQHKDVEPTINYTHVLKEGNLSEVRVMRFESFGLWQKAIYPEPDKTASCGADASSGMNNRMAEWSNYVERNEGLTRLPRFSSYQGRHRWAST